MDRCHNIEQGLQLGSEDCFSGAESSKQVNIAEQGTLSGFGGVAGISTTLVCFQVGTAESIGTHTFTVGGNVTNNGTMATGVSGQQSR